MWQVEYDNIKKFTKQLAELDNNEQLIVQNWIANLALSGPIEAARAAGLEIEKIKGADNQYEVKLSKRAGKGKPTRVSFHLTKNTDGDVVKLLGIGHT